MLYNSNGFATRGATLLDELEKGRSFNKPQSSGPGVIPILRVPLGFFLFSVLIYNLGLDLC